jgi:hypothetical protein
MFLPLILNTQTANAQNTNYTITNVDHKVEVLYSGHTIISDTIQISGQLPNNLQIGFPHKYAAYVLKGVAYDSNNQTIPMTLGAQLQSQSGFYGASLSFPSGISQTFTVVFILTNNLLTPTTSGFTLDFPAYPSLTTTASQVTSTLDLPVGSSNVKIAKPDGAINTTSYTTNNLPAFTSSTANATFSSEAGYIQQVTIPTLDRQINISPSGELTCTDTYKLINNAASRISSFKINLPFDASNIVGKDQFGRTLTVAIQDSNVARAANVSLILAVNSGESSLITIDYKLPSSSPQSGQFVLNLDLFPYVDYYVEAASVTINPPEGAQIVTPQLTSIGSSTDLTRNAYQETLTINKEGVSYIDSIIPSEDVASITVNYSSLWISFRPSSWMWALAIVGSVVVAVYKRPKTKAKAAPTPTTKIAAPKGEIGPSREQIKTFAEAYEEKNRINTEIASLDARAQRGRIPRQKYKAKRKKLELRLSSLNQTITHIGELMRNVGGNYADVSRQLENAETELSEVEQSIKAAQTRHEIGELPLGDYRKQLEDLERRKTKVEGTISGLLLRLR